MAADSEGCCEFSIYEDHEWCRGYKEMFSCMHLASLTVTCGLNQSLWWGKLRHQGAIWMLKKELSMVHGTLNIFQE